LEDIGCGPIADLPDEELLALTPGEPEAFGAFYERHVRLVMGYLVRATGDTERALDLTAEVFAAALAGAGRFKPVGPPAGAWLIGIARNKLAAAHGTSQAAIRQRVSRGLAKLAGRAREEEA
jgi:hypothetical protein